MRVKSERGSNAHAPWLLLRTCTQSYTQNNWNIYFPASGCRRLFRNIRVGIRGKGYENRTPDWKRGSAERDELMEKLSHFSFADTHRTLAVLFSSSHCENWCFLGRCCPLLRTTSCGRGIVWTVTKGMELRERSGDTLNHEGYKLIDSGNFDSGTESAGE